MTRPIAKTEDPLSAARDYGLSAFDAATFGYGPSQLGLQSQTAQAHANLGLLDPLAETIGYAAGPGKILGPLARGAVGVAAPAVAAPGASLAARVAGSVGAGALEGGAAGGAGAAGHGGDAGDIAQGALVGTVGGAASGAVGGLGPKPKTPEVGQPQSSTGAATGMYAQKVAAYAPLDNIVFNNQGSALNQAQAGIRAVRDPNGLGVDLGIPKDVNDIVASLSNNPIVSGRNLQQASRDLRDTGDWTAHRFADAIDNHLDTAQPMSINGVPTGQIGEAGAAKDAGDLIYSRIEGLERLAKETPSGAPGPTPSAVQKTKSFYDPSDPEYQTLDALQQAMQPKFSFYGARHIAGPLIGAGLLGAEGYFNPAERQNPYVTAGREALEGALLFKGLKGAAQANPTAALNAARYTIATGQPMSTATGRVNDALSNLLFGRSAANQWPY
jgi:hypothetical protein